MIFEKYLENSIYRAIHPKLFDVSLRDGIQSADPAKWPTERKKEMFRHIVATQTPANMEIGSLVSPKVLPIMGDSLELYEYARGGDALNSAGSNPELYMLIPSLGRLYTALNYHIPNLSFITSVSEAFQRKNTQRGLDETKAELTEIERVLFNNRVFSPANRDPEGDRPPFSPKTKLYISCITECPLTGKIDLDFVLREILMYHYRYNFDELCLSDTCGTLTFEEYEYLLETLLFFSVPPSKLSLHLHVSPENRETIQRIVWLSLDKHVHKFDVSCIETGGCSVTMSASKCLPNLSYDLFYEILDKYIACRGETA